MPPQKLKNQYKTLRLILGDQLNAQHSWFKAKDSSTLYVIAELHQEATYVKHHIQKISAFFAAMESFANALQHACHHVIHLTLDDTQKYTSLNDLLSALCEQYKVQSFEYQQADEYRLDMQLENMELPGMEKQRFDSEHFLLERGELSKYIKPGKHHRMESFYRKMRVRFDVLMEGKVPEGGQWNFDKSNREKLKSGDIASIPEPFLLDNDVEEILKRIKKHNIPTFGKAPKSLIWPITRKQAEALLQHFCQHNLVHFGRFQDAMTNQSEHSWSLYHSRLSFAMNSKMLHPMRIIEEAVKAFRENSAIDISQVEGFVRQILGWREYIRAVYWVNMPDYAKLNHFDGSKELPEYFWSGKTKMHCMSKAITQSLDYAYAHHIQRLMVTGNFCLLVGMDPKVVDDWYLGIYIDAIEWVEMPNTRGMSQFADGGLIATKPYAASGNYINKMSDYCIDCEYNVKQKVGEGACPLNSLYWNFMAQHQEQLEKNPRIGFVYKQWNKVDENEKKEILKQAKWYLDNIEAL